MKILNGFAADRREHAQPPALAALRVAELGDRQAGRYTLESGAEGARIMDASARNYPTGNLRVSDADRDRALGELSVALQAGRISADEFDERSAQALAARTGNELIAPLADLPAEQALAPRAPVPRASALEPARGTRSSRTIIAASVAATCFGFIAAANALKPEPTLQQREWAQETAARMGVHIPLPPAQGFDWAGTITPAAVALLLVVLVIVLHVTRTRRG
jgi:hypothetical protein